MKTYTIYKYEFLELDDDAKEKAIESMYDVNVNYDWWDFVIDDIQEQLTEMGIDKPKVRFSGFWSQGDGASFTGETIDLITLIEYLKLQNEFKLLYTALNADMLDYAAYISGNTRDVHEYSCRFEIDSFNYFNDDLWDESEDKYTEQYDLYEQEMKRLQEYLEDWRLDYSQDIYHRLEKEYEYLTSKDAIVETILANEYEFNKDGSF